MSAPSLGVLCTHMEGHYQSKILHACMSRAHELGYGTLILASGPLEYQNHRFHDSNFIFDLANDNLDGLVILGGALESLIGSGPVRALVQRLQRIPKINISSMVPGVPSIMTDNYNAVFRLVEHLVTVHQCRKIAFFPMQEQHEEGLERLQGYRAGLLAQGIQPDDALVIPMDVYPDAARGLRILIDERGLRVHQDFDALILADEYLQMEIGPALQQRGIRIPQDLALAAFDFIDAQESTYSFFAMAQSLELIGRRSIDLLDDQIHGREVPARTLIPPRPLSGTSCGCPDNRMWIPPLIPPKNQFPVFDQTSYHQLVDEAFNVLPEPLLAIVESLREQLYQDLVAAGSDSQSLFLQSVARNLVLAEDNEGRDSETLLYLLEEMIRGLERFRMVVDGAGLPKEIQLRCDGLVLSAIRMIAESRFIVHERLMRFHRRVDWRIRATVQQIHAVGTRQELMHHFIRHCLWLEIPNAGLCLFDGGSGGAIRVYAACAANEAVPIPDEGWPVPAGRILPDQLLPGYAQRNALVLPLYFGNEALGYMVMEVTALFMQDLFVFQTLRLVISGALNSTKLILETETARRAAEQANRAKGEFLARMSHELRTPLNGILGFAELLQRDGGLSEEQQESVGIISASGEHLLSLINDLLDFSRIEAQKFELYPRAIQLRPFLNELVQIIIGRAIGKGLEFRFDLQGDVPPALVLDDRRLRQVLLNLLSNACKFTAQGSVQLDVACGIPDPEGMVSLRFQVADTGPGMDQQALLRLFTPFEQLGDRESRQDGSGLGLAISQQLAQQMGGHILVDSQVGLGSRFSFEIKVSSVRDASAAPAAGDRESPGQSGGFTPSHHWMLVAENNEGSRRVLVARLESLGFSLTQAASGEEVLQSMEIASPDIILIDQGMPGISGEQTARLVRQRPDGANPVIILMGDHDSEQARQSCRDAGCDAFLAKPINETRLLRELATSGRLREDPATIDQDGEVPPVAELAEVLDLARSGKLPRIREFARLRWHRQVGLAGFCRTLDGLLEEYDGPAIIKLVQSAIHHQGAGS